MTVGQVIAVKASECASKPPTACSDFSDEVIGSVMKKSLLAYKNDEWERYHQAVTDWEVKEYLRLY